MTHETVPPTTASEPTPVGREPVGVDRIGTAEPDRGEPRSRDIRLSTVIGLAFTLILLLSSGGLVWLNHEGASRLVQKQIDQQFGIIVSGIASQVSRQLAGAKVALDTLSVSPPATDDPEVMGLVLARVLADLVETSPAVLSLVTAGSDGAYVIARRVVSSDAAARRDGDLPVFELQFGSPTGEDASDRYIFLDDHFRPQPMQGPDAASFDARVRPWYAMATRTDKAVTTPAYRFKDDNGYGFTLSRRVERTPGRVFGVDISLVTLSETLKRGLVFPGEHVVVFTPDGSLVGDSGEVDLAMRLGAPPDARTPDRTPTDLLDEAVYAAYRQGPAGRDIVIDDAGAPTYVDIARIAVNGTDLVIASTVPVALFAAPTTRLLLWTLAIQAGVVAIAALLVSVASRSIASPIGTLASDVEAIIQFRFPQRARVASRIREIRHLAGAVETLEVALRAFSTYLPPGFVRAIVEGGQAPGLGGRRETVIVMFTDIEGFTGISEATSPDELMPQLSRYFTVISDEILASGGTLDKFIGDSVMAFWPLPPGDTGRAAAVCRAVLRASAHVDALNATFAAEGRPVLKTRFGLHAGDAMVGSVGTAERMNYTALGHTVNVASRIEQLNKVHGTRVLASAALSGAASDDIRFRHVEATVLRGTQERMDVYEVLTGEPDGRVRATRGPQSRGRASSAGSPPT